MQYLHVIISIILKLPRFVFEQQQIKNDIYNIKNDFHNKIQDKIFEKLKIMEDTTFADLYLITLFREILVLKDFEDHENALTQEAEKKLQTVREKESDINTLKDKIHDRNTEIEEYSAEISNTTDMFEQAAQNNNFYGFLKKVFKKKFKPPKVQKDDGIII